MYFTHALLAIGLLATSALAGCTPNRRGCGTQQGVPGVNGDLYICDPSGRWAFSSHCNGPTCCALDDSDGSLGAHCIC